MIKKYDISGMSCAACSARVEKAVSSLDGVESCAVNLLTNSMRVKTTLDDAVIISAVERAGYGARPSGENTAEASAEREESRRLLTRLISSSVILAVLMYVSMGHVMLGLPLPAPIASRPLCVAVVEAVLALAVMVINRKFFINGFRGVIHGAANMDTLVALGSGVSFLWSLYLVFTIPGSQDAHHVLMGLYFESAAMILTLITIGKTLEAKAKGRTTDAIRELLALTPDTVTVIRDGAEVVIRQSELVVGDIFVVRPGERIATDGIVTDGASAVDESCLTGESMPQDKTTGSKVFAATINRSGVLYCRAEAVGADTAMSRVVELVKNAQGSKAPIAKVADKVSGVFVPIVLAIALVTTLVWTLVNGDFGHALGRGIAVLVISCPCALGLATPVSIMVGSGMGAKRGILFKSAEALELSGRAVTVAFDKTGTVTEGRAQVSRLSVFCDDERELLDVIVSIEAASEHPIGRAAYAYATEHGGSELGARDFSSLVGCGVRAEVCGEVCYGASYDFIKDKFELYPDTVSNYRALCEEGKTPVFFTKGARVLGMAAISDKIRADSRDAVSALHDMGIKTVMLTGDNERSASAVAREVGIDECYAHLMPDDKESKIASLKERGVVIMVGDGINDAPSLTAADVGMAIGRGTDIAIESADVVLSGSSLYEVVNSVRLGRATLTTIRQNLFWAFIYNLLGIPLAAGVFATTLGWELPPMFGALAMSLSSLFVVGNALRLNVKKVFLKQKEIKEMKTQRTLYVDGMMCAHCEAHVKKALEGIDGIESAVVSHESKTAILTLGADVDDAVIIAAVKAEGYDARF